MPLLFFLMAIWPGLTALASEDVGFILSNSDYVDVPLNGTTEDYKKFIKDEDCKFVTHGMNVNSSSGAVQDIKNNFLKCSKVNVIAIDWGKESQSMSTSYIIAAGITQKLAKKVGDKMMELVSAGVCRLNNTHCIGHSMGAHICADAASYVQDTWGKNISRLSVLDPARVLFEHNSGILPNINEEDACFVDSIHTTQILGYVKPVGQVDFFPNGGVHPQPGCDINDVLCSHSVAYELFAESICNPTAFLSTLCGSYAEYESGRCEGNPTAHMGEYCSRNASGEYYLKTTS